MAAESPVKSADRVLNLLELLALAPTAQSFTELSQTLEIPKSSLFQLLKNLLARGYVRQDEDTGRYLLGDKVRELAAKRGTRPPEEVVAPYLEAACRDLNETCAFYQRVGEEAQVIATRSGGQALGYSMRLGDRAPLFVISAGRAILAAGPDRIRDAYLHGLTPVAFTDRTTTDIADIRRVIERAASTGFAYSIEEFTKGVVGIARTVALDGNVIGAVNFAIPAVRFDKELDLKAQRVLTATAENVQRAFRLLPDVAAAQAARHIR
jgi:DNA-binding IclR family transcriptional regulator